MQETAMCWGFDCGAGWYQILYTLCGNIQNHVTWARRSRADTILFNRAMGRAIRGDIKGLIWYHSRRNPDGPTDYTYQCVERDLKETKEARDPLPKVEKVVAVQVKEKFGTLRFYYNGGDEYVSGLVSMAESMSAHTCEVCANPAKTRGRGWIVTQCDPCYNTREERRAKELAEYNASMEETYRNIDGC